MTAGTATVDYEGDQDPPARHVGVGRLRRDRYDAADRARSLCEAVDVEARVPSEYLEIVAVKAA